MKVELKFWHGLVVMGVIALLLQFKSCNSERQHNNDLQTVLDYIANDTVKQYIAEDGTTVNYNNALQVKFDAFLAAQDSFKNYLENIKIPKPDVITVYSDRFYVDSIPQIGLGITDCDFDTTFSIKDPWYEINGRLTNESLSLQNIMIPNKTTLVIGNRKTKWWKRKEYIATVDNSNPYIKTESLQSFTFKDKQSRLSIGPSLGYSFYYDPWKGNAGHGFTGGLSLNYRVIGWTKK